MPQLARSSDLPKRSEQPVIDLFQSRAVGAFRGTSFDRVTSQILDLLDHHGERRRLAYREESRFGWTLRDCLLQSLAHSTIGSHHTLPRCGGGELTSGYLLLKRLSSRASFLRYYMCRTGAKPGRFRFQAELEVLARIHLRRTANAASEAAKFAGPPRSKVSRSRQHEGRRRNNYQTDERH